MRLLDELNSTYMRLHEAKERAFWATRMGHKDAEPSALEAHDLALKMFNTDPKFPGHVREALAARGLSAEDQVALRGWQRFFAVNTVENPDARLLQEKIVGLETSIEKKIQDLPLSYVNPANGAVTPVSSSSELGLVMQTSDDEGVRKAAYAARLGIGHAVLANGFLDIVKERNKFARLLGHEDYYEYKLQTNEGFSKKELFAILDDLEKSTLDACEDSVKAAEQTFGPSVREPWNFARRVHGALTAKIDPFFPFAQALETWGRTFAAMGVDYQKAELTLDLCSRQGKYENGFMHGPRPTVETAAGGFTTAAINFTSYAIPGAVGSGKSALETLLHEGGHAAHFANIRMPAPCFSQEFAPTSASFAETQSMFFDSLAADADWCARYAGMPEDLLVEVALQDHRDLAMGLRNMLSVCYAEKALYEMSERELTAANVTAVFNGIERRLIRTNGRSAPVLAVPHILSADASCYFHSYVLAQMAVYQTRAYFLRRDGHLLDNPKIGKDLAARSWKPGNAHTFLELVKAQTEAPFSAAATIALVNRTEDDVRREVREGLERERRLPRHTGKIRLNASISLVHGDELIASIGPDGDFEALAERFGRWLSSRAKN